MFSSESCFIYRASKNKLSRAWFTAIWTILLKRDIIWQLAILKSYNCITIAELIVYRDNCNWKNSRNSTDNNEKEIIFKIVDDSFSVPNNYYLAQWACIRKTKKTAFGVTLHTKRYFSINIILYFRKEDMSWMFCTVSER